LAGQNTNEKFEVIVVDNNSTDHTSEEAVKYQKKLDLTIIKEKKKGRGAARAAGFDHAKGEIIFSTDADTIVPPDWIDAILKSFQNKRNVGFTGRCTIRDCGIVKNTLFNIFQPAMMVLFRVRYGHYWLSGFNFAVTKRAYDQSGGFDRELNALEDVDIAVKVSKFGRIVFHASPAVTFSGRRFRKDYFRGIWSYMEIFKHYRRGNKNIILRDIR
jgi:glycosyltransferase involved in cell wall biosynthesis